MKTTIAAVLIMMAGLTASAQTNLVQNGGFEQGNLKTLSKEGQTPFEWYFNLNTSRLPGAKLSYSTSVFYEGKKSVKMNVSACEVQKRYDMLLLQNLGVIKNTKLTLTFYVKSNNALKLAGFLSGTETESGKSLTGRGASISVDGSNKWKKYSVQLDRRPYGDGHFDLSKDMFINVVLDKQVLESDVEFYIDQIELL